MTDRVFVRGLEFEGNHGHTAAERRGTRRFRVNVDIERPLSTAVATDQLSDTINYAKVCEIVIELGRESTFKLLEALAGTMCQRILELYPAGRVAVELEKLAPPCPGVPDACGVCVVMGPLGERK